MIILIAGASHTGKTLLAQRLLEKYHFPYLSIRKITGLSATMEKFPSKTLCGSIIPISNRMWSRK